MKKLFTSESVTEGHPDKVCDRISDAVLDAFIAKDKNARVACETFCTTGTVTIMGEITSAAEIDIEKIARDAIIDIGYDGFDSGFDGNTCKVNIALDEQSADIALGVDLSLESKENGGLDNGAGDQGMMLRSRFRTLLPKDLPLYERRESCLIFVRTESLRSPWNMTAIP